MAVKCSHRILFLCLGLIFTATQGKSATEANPRDWLPLVFYNAVFNQHSFKWERLQTNSGKLTLVVNGTTYEIETSKPPNISKGVTPSVKSCFGDSLNVGVDIFGLQPVDKLHNENAGDVLKALIHYVSHPSAGDVAELLELDVRVIRAARGLSALEVLLNLYEGYDVQQKWQLAGKIQRYLATPQAANDISAFAVWLEQANREAEPEYRKRIELLEKHVRNQPPNEFDPGPLTPLKISALTIDQKKKVPTSRWLEYTQLRLYGRQQCFASK